MATTSPTAPKLCKKRRGDGSNSTVKSRAPARNALSADDQQRAGRIDAPADVPIGAQIEHQPIVVDGHMGIGGNVELDAS